MENRKAFLDEIAKDFDLDRIKNLSLPEKFKLVHYVKLIHTEAHFASREGVMHLAKSSNYTANKTYNLFAMLVVNGTKPEIVKEIVLNYAHNFEKSDSYYSLIAILGIGIMLIEKGFTPHSIFNYLILLLGDDFLTENLKFNGLLEKDEIEKLVLDMEIDYKPFEGNMRQLKYELLALLQLSHDKGIDFVRDVINNSYDNDKLQIYFNMMNTDSPNVVEYFYDEFKKNPERVNRLLISGAYAIVHKLDVFTTHYLFNSIIGKYSRYDKGSDEIETELNARLREIEMKIIK